jgi:ADP-ribosylglycohydrolase
MMLGAIAGDVIGSVYENHPTKRVDFQPLVHPSARFTDDSVLTIATAHAILTDDDDDSDYARAYRLFGRKYPYAGYGGSFFRWLQADDDEAGPYNSWGNGSAMRVSPIGWAFDTRERVLLEAKRSASVTHNHSEGIKGAQATALAIYLARMGSDKPTIQADLEATFGYDLGRSMDDIRPAYHFDVSCQGSVPQAIIAFLESTSVVHAIRLAVSLGGDSDTQACIAGSIAQAHYGTLEPDMVNEVRRRLPPDLLQVMDSFVQRFVIRE